MKYFTPELILRTRSDDEAIAEAANEAFDAARDEYWKRSQRIRKRLAAGNVNQIEEQYSLHDARLLSVELSQAKPLVVLTLQLEGRGNKDGVVLEIKYQTVPRIEGAFVLRQHPELQEVTARRVVLYDEFDAEDDYLTHALLLTGLAIVIRFTSLQVRRPREPVYPVGDLTQALEMAWR
jgi:hypothetical protein